MNLIERLYPADEEYLQSIWDRFIFFDPKLSYLKLKTVRQRIHTEDKSYFIELARRAYLPHEDDTVVQDAYRAAINRGIKTVNALCKEHLPDVSDHFNIADVPEKLGLFELLQSARNDWILARTGRHGDPDPELMHSAYDKVRANGLGYRILMIDESPEVLNSFRYNRLALNWFWQTLGFNEPQESDLQDFSHVWQTSAGVKLYGSSNAPIRSRLKNQDSKTGELNYGSILMKMFLKERFPDKVMDYTGVEFIVEDESARQKLVHFFRIGTKAVDKLEAFKRTADSGFNITKFLLRPPIAVSPIEGHPLGKLIHERIPVEVQILTLADDAQRKANPAVAHEEYKRRQFEKVFPVWFPREIYEPLLN